MVDIKPAQNKPDQNTIDVLTEILEEAKRGEIAGVAFAVDYNNEQINISHAGKNSTDLMGAVVALQADLVDHWRSYRS